MATTLVTIPDWGTHGTGNNIGGNGNNETNVSIMVSTILVNEQYWWKQHLAAIMVGGNNTGGNSTDGNTGGNNTGNNTGGNGTGNNTGGNNTGGNNTNKHRWKQHWW